MYIRSFYRGKSTQKLRLLLSVPIFLKKLPKVKNHPIGYNSPNLVTLMARDNVA
jgi:hypothetical protein